jgi:hypothetical protein
MQTHVHLQLTMPPLRGVRLHQLQRRAWPRPAATFSAFLLLGRRLCNT